jgi:lipoprotein-releasing system ATP-binding protein
LEISITNNENTAKKIMILTAENLSKKYGLLSVLQSVSLTIRQGEFVAIVGPSGAGKSTLLHLLGSLDTPDTGSIKLLGTDILSLPKRKQAEFRNKNMGFVFQFHHLLPEFNAVENVCMPLWIAGTNKRAARQKAEEVLDTVGLSHRLLHKPNELSGGEQQRVAIARAIVHHPAIIFADEPTGNLDTANAASVHELFFRLRQSFNQTFVIVTHNTELAGMADRTLLMKDGRIEKEICPERMH